MKAGSLNIFAIAMFLMALANRPSEAGSVVFDNSRVLATVQVARGGIDKKVYNRFDRLVPELKKISTNRVVVLECLYSGKPEREQDILKAYQLAWHIEKYMRERHKLNLDLWITVRQGEKRSKALPVLTIAVLADDIKRAESLPVDFGK